jgi:hypothetical protein
MGLEEMTLMLQCINCINCIRRDMEIGTASLQLTRENIIVVYFSRLFPRPILLRRLDEQSERAGTENCPFGTWQGASWEAPKLVSFHPECSLLLNN